MQFLGYDDKAAKVTKLHGYYLSAISDAMQPAVQQTNRVGDEG